VDLVAKADLGVKADKVADKAALAALADLAET
jgi:hypothetical protein